MPRRRAHGQGTLILRGQTYHLQMNYNGRKVSRSLQTSDPIEAQRRAEDYLQQFRLLNDTATTSFDSAAIKEIRRIEIDTGPGQANRARQAFQSFAAFTMTQNLKAIDTHLLEDFQRHRLQTRSRSTVDKELVFLLRLLRENGLQVQRPSAKRGRRTIIRAFSPDELVRLFAHVTDHFRTLYATLLLTGARPTELVPSRLAQHLALLKTEVNLEQNTVLIRTAKGHSGEQRRPRLIPIPEDLADALARQIASNPGSCVFAPCSNLARAFNATLDRAGIEKVTPDGTLLLHSFRHTYGTLQAAGGMESFHLAHIMGHAKASTTERYVDAAHTRAPVLSVPIRLFPSDKGEENAKRPDIGGKIGVSPKEKPLESSGQVVCFQWWVIQESNL